MKCTNCSKHFHGKYCPHCGAKAPEVSNKLNISKSAIVVVGIVFIVLIAIIIFIALGPSKIASLPTPTVLPTASASSPSASNADNYLISLEMNKEQFVDNLTGESITKRVLRADKEKTKETTEEEFIEFYREKVFGKGYTDYHLVFEDNSGILFTNGAGVIIYGEFNDCLNLLQIDKVISLKGNSLSVRDCKTDSGKPYKLPDADSIPVIRTT